MEQVLCGLSLGFLSSAPAIAADSMDIALNPRTVISADESCGLRYDLYIISAQIIKHVRADDMNFPAMVNSMIGGSEVAQTEISPSAKTAHCVQIARTVRSYGFIK